MTATNGIGEMWRHKRVLAASLIGTAVEFYDFYIYATAARLIFPALFFPASSPTAQLMASYGSLALAFFARPLGAAVFGHYGDRVGRKATLVTSLMLMGGCTLAIGFLPPHAQIGWWAPLILCLLRFGQGLGLGGEWGGAALLAVENAPPGWRARCGMFPQLGAPGGFIAANGLFLILGVTLSDADFFAWGWRLPFLGSAVLVFLGLWVRLKLTETPDFAAAQAAARHLPCRSPRCWAIIWARPSPAPSRSSPASRAIISRPPSRSATARPRWGSTGACSWRCSWARSCSWRSASSLPAGGPTRAARLACSPGAARGRRRWALSSGR